MIGCKIPEYIDPLHGSLSATLLKRNNPFQLISTHLNDLNLHNEVFFSLRPAPQKKIWPIFSFFKPKKRITFGGLIRKPHSTGSMTKSLVQQIARKTYRYLVHPLMKRVARKLSAGIPRHPLLQRHVANGRLLASREVLLEHLPQGGIVAEIGVDEGRFSRSILDLNRPEKLHLVDLWGSKRYGKAKQRGVEEQFAREIETGRVTLHVGYSTEVANHFNDHYFDWIYIDTSHSYKVTIAELEAYRTKVKPGGIIAGHDYVICNWNGMVRYGVIEAVYEFCSRHDWEILWLTTEITDNPSFAIRQIVE